MEPQRSRPDAAVSKRFASRARSHTGPEISLRKELHKRGLRFRVQYRISGIPRRRIDIAFPRWKLAVSVDGCFWHACPDHCKTPATNHDWWRWKFETNISRDKDTDARLGELGWTSIRIWEHEEPVTAADRVQKQLNRLREG
ncbi:very short patch repair endonuclease [Kytococcus sp. HMSC28H12]|uniref:very short patch repair endonuclease n=1 Tax=Kytococcus sp. HMSC28H12 TaxID=1581067 RepID=UPI0009F22848|nr:very short patch repair endonuclease [Kytococcus sp. HMSC28H12]